MIYYFILVNRLRKARQISVLLTQKCIYLCIILCTIRQSPKKYTHIKQSQIQNNYRIWLLQSRTCNAKKSRASLKISVVYSIHNNFTLDQLLFFILCCWTENMESRIIISAGAFECAPDPCRPTTTKLTSVLLYGLIDTLTQLCESNVAKCFLGSWVLVGFPLSGTLL